MLVPVDKTYDKPIDSLIHAIMCIIKSMDKPNTIVLGVGLMVSVPVDDVTKLKIQ